MTLADKELVGYERDITVRFEGAKYPLFVLMERLLKITNADGKCVDFHLNDQQIILYKEMCKQRREGKPVRINILKARQIGFSTFIAGVLFLITMFTPNVKSAVIADIADHASNIFDKYNFFYDHLDDNNPNRELIEKEKEMNGQKYHSKHSYKPVLKYAQGKTLMQTLYGNSSLEVLVAGVSAGRSATYQYVHISEGAFFPNLRTTLNGLLDTLHSSNLESMAFIETTANGFNDYHSRWVNDYSGLTNWKGIFVPWFTSKEYIDHDYDNIPRPRIEEWLEEKQRVHHLTDSQIMWYWEKYLDKSRDKNMVLQEFPFCDIDAFITSGNCVFNAEYVAQRQAELLENDPIKRRGQYIYDLDFSKDGSIIKLDNVKFDESYSGAIKIFKEPQKGHYYVGVCDPNNGGSDDTAISFFDNATLEQVAVFKSNNMTLDKVAYQFYLMGLYYNTALLTNEMNLGKTVMEYLLKLHYPQKKIYVNRDLTFDNWKGTIKTQFGHQTTKRNRSWAIDTFKIAFLENPRMINDIATLQQMATFQTVEHISKEGNVTRKDEATSGNHDDCVAVCWGFFIVRDQQKATIDEEVHKVLETIDKYKDVFSDNKKGIAKSKITAITGIKF